MLRTSNPHFAEHVLLTCSRWFVILACLPTQSAHVMGDRKPGTLAKNTCQTRTCKMLATTMGTVPLLPRPRLTKRYVPLEKKCKTSIQQHKKQSRLAMTINAPTAWHMRACHEHQLYSKTQVEYSRVRNKSCSVKMACAQKRIHLTVATQSLLLTARGFRRWGIVSLILTYIKSFMHHLKSHWNWFWVRSSSCT